MLIVECRRCTPNVCILIFFFNSTESRAQRTEHRMCKCRSSFWHEYTMTLSHTHSGAGGRARYNHLFALLCCFSSIIFEFFLLSWNDVPFHRTWHRAYVQSALTHVREIRYFCHVQKMVFLPLTPATDRMWRNTRKLTKVYSISTAAIFFEWCANANGAWRECLYCSTIYKTSSHLPNGIFSVIIWAFNPLA